MPPDPPPHNHTHTHTHILAHALTSKSLPLSSAWLATFLSSSSRTTALPLPALTQTAIFRALASDIQQSLSTADATRLLPPDVGNTGVRERVMDGGDGRE
ncbi:MAG: hypothetical protein Q9160_008387, partial [Pyrenula sp. 1 TL-2023]